jgi:signal transduction histidine kinase
MLHEFITLHRDEIIKRCRAIVAKRTFPVPTESEINHGVPLFLDQLVDRLSVPGTSKANIGESAAKHGHDLLVQGFTVSQVVHDYGDVCQTITQLAMETDAPLRTDEFRLLNQCLDEAIAAAVTIFGHESRQLASVSQDEQVKQGNERIAFLVHELRNLVNTATVAFEVLKTGNVGVGGSTGAVLERSLRSLRELIAHSLDEVRSARNVAKKKRILVSALIADVEATARLAAHARGVTLLVAPTPDDLTIDADAQILAAVIGNLLQNAFKFTHDNSTVTLRMAASAERVLIEVQDECGGLPGADGGTEIEGPFEQRAADRSGLGVGLAFSRWGAEVNGGRLYARNHADKGCIFTVDLPRVQFNELQPSGRTQPRAVR